MKKGKRTNETQEEREKLNNIKSTKTNKAEFIKKMREFLVAQAIRPQAQIVPLSSKRISKLLEIQQPRVSKNKRKGLSEYWNKILNNKEKINPKFTFKVRGICCKERCFMRTLQNEGQKKTAANLIELSLKGKNELEFNENISLFLTSFRSCNEG